MIYISCIRLRLRKESLLTVLQKTSFIFIYPKSDPIRRFLIENLYFDMAIYEIYNVFFPTGMMCRGLTQHWGRTGSSVGASDIADAAVGVPTRRLVNTKAVKAIAF